MDGTFLRVPCVVDCDDHLDGTAAEELATHQRFRGRSLHEESAEIGEAEDLVE